MSNDVFPTLDGLAWGTVRSPVWATKVLPMSSGRELRGSFQSYPRYKYSLRADVLRANGRWGKYELETLLGFFNKHGGSFESWLFRDQDDWQVTDQALGVGDAANTEFRFVREYGGFVEPVLFPGDAWVYLDRGAALGKWRVSNEERTNAFGRTEDLSNVYWTKEGGTVTTDVQADPNGASTFDLFAEDTSTGGHDFYRTTSPTGGAGVKHVVSWYVKPAGRTIIYCKSNWNGVSGGAEFDLSGAGQVNFIESNVLSAGVRALSSGIYRVWIVVRPSTGSSQSQRLYLKPSAGASVSYTGNGTSGVYVGWMQHEAIPEEAPEEPTEYIPSTSGTTTTAPPAYTHSTYGYFDFVVPPPIGVLVSWTGNFYWRCRFLQDQSDFEKFAKDLFLNKKIEFITTK